MRGGLFGVAAAWSVLVLTLGAHVSAAPPLCIATEFVLAATGAGARDNALSLVMGNRSGECFGAYPFVGVTGAQLASPATTRDGYGELAAALLRWSPADGVPAVSEWFQLGPALAVGMRAAGINPVRFGQWINEYDGAGDIEHPVLPASWPPYLPRALVVDPATIAGGAATALPPGSQRVPEGVAPGAMVPGVVLHAHTSFSVVPSSGSAVEQPLPTSHGVPPESVIAGGITLPCVAVADCRGRVLALERRHARPFYLRLAFAVWSCRWWAFGALGVGSTVFWSLRQRLRRLGRW